MERERKVRVTQCRKREVKFTHQKTKTNQVTNNDHLHTAGYKLITVELLGVT